MCSLLAVFPSSISFWTMLSTADFWIFWYYSITVFRLYRCSVVGIVVERLSYYTGKALYFFKGEFPYYVNIQNSNYYYRPDKKKFYIIFQTIITALSVLVCAAVRWSHHSVDVDFIDFGVFARPSFITFQGSKEAVFCLEAICTEFRI